MLIFSPFFCDRVTLLLTLCMFSCFAENMPELQSIVRLAMDDWESKTCLKFVERTNEKDYVTFFRGSQ